VWPITYRCVSGQTFTVRWHRGTVAPTATFDTPVAEIEASVRADVTLHDLQVNT